MRIKNIGITPPVLIIVALRGFFIRPGNGQGKEERLLRGAKRIKVLKSSTMYRGTRLMKLLRYAALRECFSWHAVNIFLLA